MLKQLLTFNVFVWMMCASLNVFNVSAQQINVEKFIVLENDLDARVTKPKKDQNGEFCALIKVVTKHTGFSFDIGSLGVVASEQKTGEIWVYIPRGAQKITIKHAQLGVLRNYIFPMPIEAANVYEMLLTTADVEIMIKPKVIETQWLVINTEPTGANIFINDEFVGKTPYQAQYPPSEYTYRLENARYHTVAGKIIINDKKETLKFDLKPRFGNIQVTSLPEEGMQIYLNDEPTGKNSPALLEKINSGKHTVKLFNEWYEPSEQTIDVKDGLETKVQFTLQPVFANIKIKTNANASIEINGVKKAEGEFNGRLRKGIYTIKIKHEKYYEQVHQLVVETNKHQNLYYELKPKMGKLDVVSNPFDATIFIDNKNYGTTPNTIKDLLIGTYTLKLQKEGYKEVQQKIEITENETINQEFTLLPDNFTSNNKAGSGTQYGRSVTDINGNTYKTVIIGNQEWMAENLKTNNYNDGSIIPNITNNAKWEALSTGAWCHFDNNNKNDAIYGKLYNWYAVNTGKLCPTGWHVPTDNEWTVLTNYLADNGYKGKEGIALKAKTTWAYNGNGTDNFGWRGLPGGNRSSNGGFNFFENYGYWWSSSQGNTNFAWGRVLYFNYDDVYSYNYNMRVGLSVRCLRD